MRRLASASRMRDPARSSRLAAVITGKSPLGLSERLMGAIRAGRPGSPVGTGELISYSFGANHHGSIVREPRHRISRGRSVQRSTPRTIWSRSVNITDQSRFRSAITRTLLIHAATWRTLLFTD